MMHNNYSGQTVGPYHLERMIGAGGMGSVYESYQQAVNRKVALKLLPAHLAQTPDYVNRFKQEVKVAAQLEHPHILPVYDYGVTQTSTSYVVMRLLTGGSLADRLAHQRLSSKAILRMLKQVATALDYAHRQGVVHRDIKPNNILFDEEGNAYLTDFGIAKVLQATNQLTATGMQVGTPLYMAPEQWAGQPVDPRTDIYSLGVMSYYLLTGRPPFEADTPFALGHMHLNEVPTPVTESQNSLPRAVNAVMNKVMAKNPDNRFQTAGEFVAALEQALNPAIEPPARVARQSRMLMGMAGAIVVLVLIIAGLLFALAQNDGDDVASDPLADSDQATPTSPSGDDLTQRPTATLPSAEALAADQNAAEAVTDSPTDTATAPPTATPRPTATPTFIPTQRQTRAAVEQVAVRFDAGDVSAPVQEGDYIESADEALHVVVDGGETAVENPATFYLDASSRLTLEQVDDAQIEAYLEDESAIFITAGSYADGGIELVMVENVNVRFRSQGACLSTRYLEPGRVQLQCYDADCEYELAFNDVYPLEAGEQIQIDVAAAQVIDDPAPISMDDALLDWDLLKMIHPDQGSECLAPYVDPDQDDLIGAADSCPTEWGVDWRNGCPPPDVTDTAIPPTRIPDRDGDGIPDNRDACPGRSGTAANNGCPPQPTAVPPTRVPPTTVPPTAIPPTRIPPTAVPPTAAPPTAVPPTPIPDSDGDGIPDPRDACPHDAYHDPIGDPCNHDEDGDGRADTNDACPFDSYHDSVGNPCNHDEDGDGHPDERDTCPFDSFHDAVGNPCNHDEDGDGIGDYEDACPFDSYHDPVGNPCNHDEDGDGRADTDDACPNDPNHDPVGDPCNHDEDGDGWNDWDDKCPTEHGAGSGNGCPAPPPPGSGGNSDGAPAAIVPPDSTISQAAASRR